jgi:hypothetical protein
VTAAWGAVQNKFTLRAQTMPTSVWEELIRIDGDKTRRARRPPEPPVRPPTPEERRAIEKRLEDWLEANIDALEPVLGYPLEVAGRQVPCGSEHGGSMDLLVRRKGRKRPHIVVELKATAVLRDAIAQALGYIGYLQAIHGVQHCEAVVIGVGTPHPQVPFVLDAIPPIVDLRDWDEFDLPPELRREVARAALG